MRKSGPFRSIRLCAYTAVGADSGVSGILIAGGDVPVEVLGAAGGLATLLDLTCQTTNPISRMQADARTTNRARIQYILWNGDLSGPTRRIYDPKPSYSSITSSASQRCQCKIVSDSLRSEQSGESRPCCVILSCHVRARVCSLA